MALMGDIWMDVLKQVRNLVVRGLIKTDWHTKNGSFQEHTLYVVIGKHWIKVFYG